MRVRSVVFRASRSQAAWIKQMTPVADWLIHAGRDVVEALDLMQRRSAPGAAAKVILPGAFRVLEGLYVPEDYQALARRLKDESVPENVARMKTEAQRLIRARSWSWFLLQPALPKEKIHEDRNMFPVAPVAPVGTQLLPLL